MKSTLRGLHAEEAELKLRIDPLKGQIEELEERLIELQRGKQPVETP